MFATRPGSRFHSALRLASRLCFISGALALAAYGFAWGQREVYQAVAAKRFDRMRIQPVGLQPQPAALPFALPGEATAARTSAHADHRQENSGAAESVVGRIIVPRIGLGAMVAEGDDDGTLQFAVGHIPGTALPGQQGNVGLAGHRDTFFHSLGGLHPGDAVRLETLHGTFLYRVRWARIVAPEAVSVLEGGAMPSVTLVTCYPFNYIGAAPMRYVVRAELDTNRTARAHSSSQRSSHAT